MKKIVNVAIVATLVIFATTAIFIGCKKEENKVVENKKIIAKEKIQKGNISEMFRDIDISRIGYEEGQLVFESMEHYAQTIDALVNVCEEYSRNYYQYLEQKFQLPIEEINEDYICDMIENDKFFPYNPLQDFIELIGFSESLYPKLRQQEIEWLSDENNFETQPNPFDAFNAGYVQSALHNIKGEVSIYLQDNIEDWIDLEELEEEEGPQPRPLRKSFSITINPTKHASTKCQRKDKDKQNHFNFSYKGKSRQLRAVLATNGLFVRGKTTCYTKDKHNNPILWTHGVMVEFDGSKWIYCDMESPIYCYKAGSTKVGIVEKYYWFNHVPTYLIPYQGASITGKHYCKDHNTIYRTYLMNN